MKKILILPQTVVDRIAAGEVVQRPASAVKELVENCLDAGATDIKVQTDGSDRITISDNGCGIEKEDLKLAAVRHATSKLQTAEDLSRIQSFGFRGEALASISMISRLSIVSKTDLHPAAYRMSYLDGKPTMEAPIPTARTRGTTVTIQDLFYNMLHRRKGMRPNDEYNAILRVLQLYAVHYARFGVAFHCQKMAGKSGNNNSSKTDLNTSIAVTPVRKTSMYKNINHSSLEDGNTTTTDDNASWNEQRLEATKQVIAQVYGTPILPHLNEFRCKLIREEKNSKCFRSPSMLSTLQNDIEEDSDGLVYSCVGILSSPTYQSPKGIQFVLFINNRLVDGCTALKRTIESSYAEYTKNKPFIYLSLVVPPSQVDVNVHPTKREVALLHMDEICNDIASYVKQHLSAQGQTFLMTKPIPSCGGATGTFNSTTKKRKQEETTTSLSADNDSNNEIPIIRSTSKQLKIAPNKFIRTNRSTQAGSLEPFLVSTQATPASPLSSATKDVDSSNQLSLVSSQPESKHKPDCLLLLASTDEANSHRVDFTIPGAFASVAAQCTCSRITISNETADDLSPAGAIRLPRQPLRKLKRLEPHPCSYKSIQSLRKHINKHADLTLQRKIRSASFVGVASYHRSLVQCGEELVMMNHYECARQMFYQLALNRFGSGDSAKFGSITSIAIDIVTVISQIVQIEESIHDPDFLLSDAEVNQCFPVSDTNMSLAEQACDCLFENGDMLEEYFAIEIRKDPNGRIVLTGLPLLLDGYEPSPHGLPLFLLRLATEVDWSTEKRCFHGVCRELGSYYAQLPSGEDHASLIRHTIFPAVSSLLVPSKYMTKSSLIMTMASLSGLYRVFERC